jgi:hypothetical protein
MVRLTARGVCAHRARIAVATLTRDVKAHARRAHAQRTERESHTADADESTTRVWPRLCAPLQASPGDTRAEVHSARTHSMRLEKARVHRSHAVLEQDWQFLPEVLR